MADEASGFQLVSIERLGECRLEPSRLREGLDEIFFEASNTKSFASAQERALFRIRWLGRYLADYPDWAHVAVADGREIAGYLVGCPVDPAVDARFADVGYFHLLGDLTAQFPAHLHINCRSDRRGRGIGSMLVRAHLADAQRARLPGVHVVTGQGARNIGFYLANQFAPVREFEWSGKPLVMLARRLAATPARAPSRDRR